LVHNDLGGDDDNSYNNNNNNNNSDWYKLQEQQQKDTTDIIDGLTGYYKVECVVTIPSTDREYNIIFYCDKPQKTMDVLLVPSSELYNNNNKKNKKKYQYTKTSDQINPTYGK
jgi:hypothetical protein